MGDPETKASCVLPLASGACRRERQNARLRSLAWLSSGLAGLALSGNMVAAADASTNAAVSVPVTKTAPAKAETDLLSLDLDALANTKVTSVSKREEKLTDAPAAITLITQEDIIRSGAKSIPEALRLVPGMEVAQSSASTWQISTRGFQGQWSDSLLVLVDGRSVYTPTFSGVYWDAEDMILEDIDRIEVIRGPGATVWGANAVNGVVNIVSKSAKDTQGALVTVASGTDRNVSSGIRYGAKFNDQTFVRFWGKYDANDDLRLRDNTDANDRWNMIRGGARLDWLPSDVSTFTLQSDVYQGDESPANTVKGANVVGRWTRTLSDTSSLELQTYWDHIDRPTLEKRDTFDVEFQHNFGWGERQTFVWGLNYRLSTDDLSQSSYTFNPAKLTQHLFGAFVQDTISIVPKKLSLTLGTKLEHNDFTGLEVQPSARLAWKPTEKQTVWGAISRAVRTPNRFDTAVVVPIGGGTRILSNPNFQSQTLIAYELGYRIQPIKPLAFDLATYYNTYDRIKNLSFGVPDWQTVNTIKGQNYGFDLSATYQPLESWRLTPFFSYIHSHFNVPAGGMAVVPLDEPQNQVGLRSSVDFAKNWQFDVTGRYVDNWRDQGVPAYVTADVRLAWKATKNIELAIVGQNLVDNIHLEGAAGTGSTAYYIPRSVYGKLTFKF